MPGFAEAVFQRTVLGVKTAQIPQIIHSQAKQAEKRVDSARLVLEVAGILKPQSSGDDRRVQIAIVSDSAKLIEGQPTVDPFED